MDKQSSKPKRASCFSSCFSSLSDRDRTQSKPTGSSDHFSISIADSPPSKSPPSKGKTQPRPTSYGKGPGSSIEYHKLYAQEYTPEYEPLQFLMKIPGHALPGQVIVNVGGHADISVVIPDDVYGGETVILIARGPKKRINSMTSTTSTATLSSSSSSASASTTPENFNPDEI